MASSWRDLQYLERNRKNRKLQAEKQAFDVLKFQITDEYRKEEKKRAERSDARTEERFADFQEQKDYKDIVGQYAPILESLENFDITPDELGDVEKLAGDISLQRKDDDSILLQSAYQTLDAQVKKMVGNVQEIHNVRKDFSELVSRYHEELGQPEKEGSYNPEGMKALMQNAINKAEYYAKEGNEAALTGSLQWVEKISKTHYVERELDRFSTVKDITPGQKAIYDNARRAYDAGVPELAYQHLTGQVGLELAEQKAGIRDAKDIEDEAMNSLRKKWGTAMEKERPAAVERKVFGQYYPAITKLQAVPSSVTGWDLVNNPHALDMHNQNMIESILKLDDFEGNVLEDDIPYFGTGKMRDVRADAYLAGVISRAEDGKAGHYVYADKTDFMIDGKIVKNKDILEYEMEMSGAVDEQIGRNIEALSERYDTDWDKDEGGDGKELATYFAGVSRVFLGMKFDASGIKEPDWSKSGYAAGGAGLESDVKSLNIKKQKMRKGKLDEVTKLIAKKETEKKALIKKALDHVFVYEDKSLPSKKGSEMKLEDLMKTKQFKKQFSGIDLELKLLAQRLSEIKDMEIDPSKVVLPYDWDEDYTKGDEDMWYNSKEAQDALLELGIDINK